MARSVPTALFVALSLTQFCDGAFWGTVTVRNPSYAKLASPGRLSPLERSTESVSGRPRAFSSSTTRLSMVFDFFRERSKEGLGQLQNLQNAAAAGQLGQGLAQAAAYTSRTNQAFANGLAKSRNRLLNDLEALFTGVSTEDILDELQDILLQADLGTATAEDIVREVESLREDSTVRLSKDDLKSIMRGKLLEILDFTTDQYGNPVSRAIRFANSPRSSESALEHDEPLVSATLPHMPTVIFIMGANGMGKTTTIGKLAHRLRVEGNQTVLLAACDTFRAGAVAQLQQWATRANVSLVGPPPPPPVSDSPSPKPTSPSAVLYSALDYGLAHKVDTILVDTSGRLSNNDALTQELAKMKRVIQKRLSVAIDSDSGQPRLNLDVPHETLLVLDASQGRVALDSARAWHEAIGLTGLILTKLDGSARGGSVVAVSRELRLPVKLVGVGEGLEDLRDVSYYNLFSRKKFLYMFEVHAAWAGLAHSVLILQCAITV
jgi:fused signal recognition particle receptor